MGCASAAAPQRAHSTLRACIQCPHMIRRLAPAACTGTTTQMGRQQKPEVPAKPFVGCRLLSRLRNYYGLCFRLGWKIMSVLETKHTRQPGRGPRNRFEPQRICQDLCCPKVSSPLFLPFFLSSVPVLSHFYADIQALADTTTLSSLSRSKRSHV